MQKTEQTWRNGDKVGERVPSHVTLEAWIHLDRQRRGNESGFDEISLFHSEFIDKASVSYSDVIGSRAAQLCWEHLVHRSGCETRKSRQMNKECFLQCVFQLIKSHGFK